MPEARTSDDARPDEALGIDRSEQPGLGGDSSVLEEYGKDTYPDDGPEHEVPAEGERQPTLPGTDPEVPRDVEAERGGPDRNLPKLGHEVREGPQDVVADLKHKSLDPKDRAGTAE